MATKPLILVSASEFEPRAPRRSLLQRAGAWVSELIGGPQRHVRRFISRLSTGQRRRDSGTTDYAFWDKARMGKAEGLEISGLLLKPLYSKLSAWTMGLPPKLRLSNNARGQERLNEWWQRNHADILQAYEESIGLADYYIVVNPDLTLTLKSPNVVFPIVDEANFGRIIGWRIEEEYPHPTEPGRYQIHIDEYRLEGAGEFGSGRVRIIMDNGREISRQTFRNLIGRLPVIHVPNLKRANEVFGHSEGEPLIPLLHLYGEILEAGAEGNIRQGRATPTIENMGSTQAVEQFWDRFGKTRTQVLPDGSTETEQYLEFDADKLLTLADTGVFNWKSPAPFIGEVERILGLLYYLFLEHVELPEWVLGTAIPGSQASANTQVEPLVKFIEKKRSLAEKWIIELAQVVLGYMGVVDVAVQTAEAPTIKWDDITTKDGQLTLAMVKFAREENLLDRKTTLSLLSALDVEDPDQVLADAEREAEERAQRQAEADEERAIRQANALNTRADAEADEDDEAEPETEPERDLRTAVA